MISDAQRENSKLVLKELFGMWDKRSGLYGDVLFASAIGKGYDKKWKNVCSFLIPMHKGELRNVGVRADYGDFKLVEGALSIEEAKKVIAGVVERDRLCFPGVPEIEIQASLHPNSRYYFWDSGTHRFPVFFPYYEYNLSVEQEFKGESTQEALYNVDLPLFPSGAAAIESFFGTRLGDNSSYGGILSMLVPDYRGRLKDVRIGTSSVQVEIQCLAGSSEKELIGKLFVRYYNGISITSDLNFTDYKASAEIRDFPRDLIVMLLSRQGGEQVDRRHFLAGSQYVTEGVTIEAPEEDLKQTVLMGESDSVEFKREIPPQQERIAIGATALANRRGGKIFIGVGDDCSIVGCQLDKPKDRITQILRSHCDPAPDVLIDVVTMRDEARNRDVSVIVVTIPEGKDKPYAVKDKGVYIRAGATNRPATRYELDEMYNGKRSGIRSVFSNVDVEG